MNEVYQLSEAAQHHAHEQRVKLLDFGLAKALAPLDVAMSANRMSYWTYAR
jgi:hypothetical protein